jgi:poly(3-hydroxybutyrate) depolymerase
MLREREKPKWGIDQVEIDGISHDIKITSVLKRPFCDLLRFERVGAEKRDDPKILLVAPMSGHYATLLRGTVEALLPDHDVYITDWVDASGVPEDAGRFGLDEYIDYLLDFFRDLAPNLHVMAVCQPAPLVLAAVAVMAAHKDKNQPRTMTLMGGPVDVTAAATLVTQSADNRPMSWYESHVIHHVPARFEGAGRQVYPGFIQLKAFMSMNPARHSMAHMEMFTKLTNGDHDGVEGHRKFYDEYLSVMDVTAEFFLETIQSIFKDFDLHHGNMKWRDEMVDPALIKDTALLTIEGELDDISAPGQTKAAQGLCASLDDDMRMHYVQDGVGHYGIFNGRSWRNEIKPRIADFIRKHNT